MGILEETKWGFYGKEQKGTGNLRKISISVAKWREKEGKESSDRINKLLYALEFNQ